MDSGSEKIEFNSMVAVLKRLSDITDRINASRFNRSADTMEDMAHLLAEYYKEIHADLDKEERKIWLEIKKLQRTILNKSNIKAAWLLWSQLDDIDLKLRDAAKRHGYLTKNAKNQSMAIIE